MRLLYVGQLWQGSTTLTRMHALASLGVDCVPFDTTPFSRSGTRLERSLLHRCNVGLGLNRLNAALADVARDAMYDAVWIDKGVFVRPETVADLRSAARRRIAVHYTPDAQLVDNRSRHFDKSLPLYDLAVTTKPFEVDAYKSSGAREVFLVLQGYGRQFDGAEFDNSLKSDVCFVGHCNRHYAARIKAASGVSSGVRVWGPRWSRYARLHAWARPIVQGEGLWGDSYPRGLASTRIALGLLSKAIPETTTTRSFFPMTPRFASFSTAASATPVCGQLYIPVRSARATASASSSSVACSTTPFVARSTRTARWMLTGSPI